MTKESKWLTRFTHLLLAVGVLGLLNLSAAHAATGRTAGQFGVSAGGSATYSIPIFVPPGPQSMQPGIALVYNSSSGGGYLGRGWSLAGLSAISRCQKSLEQDGEGYLGIGYYYDALCLDGNRLRLQSGNGSSGSTYATELADFSRVTIDGSGSQYWTVERRDGTKYTYGAANSCVETYSSSGVCRAWLVNEIQDRSGNKIVFHYSAADSTNVGLTHPTQIEWTRTSSSSSSYVYSMEFEYTSAGNAPPSSPNGHTVGIPWLDNDLLVSISVKNLTTTVRKYVLGYETASANTGVKRLTTVTECSDASESDCLSPTTIAYQNGTVGVNATASFTQSTPGVTQPNGTHDYDGNGCRDLTYRRAGAWYVRLANCSGGYGSEIATGVSDFTLMTGDPFGSGRDSLLGRSGTSPYHWYLYSWNGSIFSAADTGVADGSVVSLQDANGDGKDDMVYWIPDYYSGGYLEMRYSTSTGTTPSFASPGYNYFDPSNLDSGDPSWFIYYADLTPRTRGVNPWGSDPWVLDDPDGDGDGRPDLILDGDVTWCNWGPPFDCVSAYYSALVGIGGNGGYSQVNYGPINRLKMNPEDCDAPSGAWQEFLPFCPGGGYPINTAGVGAVAGVIDWNQDGRPDILEYLGGSTLSVQRATGTGLGSAESTNIGCTYVDEVFGNAVFITDADGDGLFDIGCLNSDGSISVQLHNGALQHPDLATSFTDGFGVTHSVAYVVSTHEGYTPTTATFPQLDVKRPQVLVRTVTASDGIGGTYTRTYSYFGAKENAQRRQYLGFDKVESVDSRNGIKQVQKFAQAFPFTGMLIEEASYQSNDTLISKRTIEPDEHVLDATALNERHFPFPLTITEDGYEVVPSHGTGDGAWITHAVTSNTFDTKGNLTASTRVVTDKDSASLNPDSYFTTATARTFDAGAISDRTTYWCLGLPTAVSVTQSSSVSGESSVTHDQEFVPDYVKCRNDSQDVGAGDQLVHTALEYDDFGNIESVSVTGTDETGDPMTPRVTLTNWGTTGQFPVEETNALSQVTTRTFDSTFGSLVTETDPNGIYVARQEYDSFGRLTRSRRADDTGTRYAYSPCSSYSCEGALDRVVVVASERDSSDSEFRVTRTHLDLFDRPWISDSQMISGDYSRQWRQFDDMGRVAYDGIPCAASSCTAAYPTNANVVTNTYDLIGRLIAQSRLEDASPMADPISTAIAYMGRTQTITDPKGNHTIKVNDVLGRMRKSQDHIGHYQWFSYDAAGSLTRVTDSAFNPSTEPLFTASYVYGIQPFRTETTDMDLGHWLYEYNSLGELVHWTDAKDQDFHQTYDALSRVTSRTDDDEGTTYFTFGTSAGNHNIGRLAEASMSGYVEQLTYDSKGRVSQRKISTDQDYFINYGYTSQGLLDTVTYPESTASVRVKVKYGYAYGILQSVRDWTGDTGGDFYWTVNTQNVRGQTTQETLGNGVVTNRDFDAVTGWLSYIHSGPSGYGTSLQNLSYAYDAVGNVTLRQEGTQGLMESFCYDNLYRLRKVKRGSADCDDTPLEITYDDTGNILTKDDVNSGATWTYHSTKKHAVTSTGSGGVSFSYDDNGNMTTRAGSTIVWSSYNYPTTIATATESSEFSYGPDRQYYRQEYIGPSGSEESHYVGGILEKVYDGTSHATDWRHYVVAAGQVVAIVSRIGSNQAVHYPLADNQGSGSTLTDDSGTNLVRQSYDAFGKPRDGADWDGAVPSGDKILINGISRRGYTGHSMLGDMGLIHMNGRVQDASTGRFLSPDPTIPNPAFTQSFNRFSYVNNNPLTFIDPSGFAPVLACNYQPEFDWHYDVQLVNRTSDGRYLYRFTGDRSYRPTNNWIEDCYLIDVDYVQNDYEGRVAAAVAQAKANKEKPVLTRASKERREKALVCTMASPLAYAESKMGIFGEFKLGSRLARVHVSADLISVNRTTSGKDYERTGLTVSFTVWNREFGLGYGSRREFYDTGTSRVYSEWEDEKPLLGYNKLTLSDDGVDWAASIGALVGVTVGTSPIKCGMTDADNSGENKQ